MHLFASKGNCKLRSYLYVFMCLHTHTRSVDWMVAPSDNPTHICVFTFLGIKRSLPIEGEDPPIREVCDPGEFKQQLP